MGRLFFAGGIVEGLILVGSVLLGWSTHWPVPVVYGILLLIGVGAIAANAGMGRILIGAHGASEIPAQSLNVFASGTPVTEVRAPWALGVGIASIVLVWPFGILLGPLAFWLGTSAVRRVNEAPQDLAGKRLAAPGAMMGALVCGAYLFWVLADVSAVFLFGSPFPAAP